MVGILHRGRENGKERGELHVDRIRRSLRCKRAVGVDELLELKMLEVTLRVHR